MAKRTVRFNLKKFAGAAAHAGLKVVVRLKRNTYTLEGGPQTFAAGEAEAEAGADGVATLELWTNADAARPVNYVCELPGGQSFPFVLPAGPGAVDVEALRLLNDVPVGPSTVELLAALLDLRAAVAVRVLAADGEVESGPAARTLVLIDTSASDVAAVLPPAAQMERASVVLKKTADENVAVVDGYEGELIDGRLVYNLEMLGEFVEVVSDGAAWWVVGKG